MPREVNEDDYGVEGHDADDEEHDSDAAISIQHYPALLPAAQMQLIMQNLQTVNPLVNDCNYGINVYKNCLQLARSVS